MNRKNILLTVLAVLVCYLLLLLSGCDSATDVLQEPVDPEELVEAEAEPEPEEVASVFFGFQRTILLTCQTMPE